MDLALPIRDNIKIMTRLIVTTTLAAIIMLFFVDGPVELPGGRVTADLWRVAAMSLAGAVMAYMVRILVTISKLRYDPNDKLIIPLGRTLGSFFLLTMLIGVHLFTVYGLEKISWRTPVAFLTMLSAIHPLYSFNKELNTLIRNSPANVRLRLTLMPRPETLAECEDRNGRP